VTGDRRYHLAKKLQGLPVQMSVQKGQEEVHLKVQIGADGAPVTGHTCTLTHIGAEGSAP
jgi:hypothetical protein